jgi:hypothetical protein
MTDRTPIRKTVFAIRFENIDQTTTQTKWFDSISQIPETYFTRYKAVILKRSYNTFARPTLAEMRECAANNDRYWLNTEEEIEEVNIEKC